MTLEEHVVCVAGMHRSGTSMMTRLLNVMGLDLGAEADLLPPAKENPAGYWERRDFVALNDEMMASLGAGWDAPDLLPDNPAADPRLDEYRARAQALLTRFEGSKVWGWKDPRNSFLLGYWRTLIPHLQVVVPLRNPLEVAASLAKRGKHSPAFSYRLWLQHYDALLADVSLNDVVVSHYDAYFHDASAELRRVWEALGLPVDERRLADACTTAIPELRHTRATIGDMQTLGVPEAVVSRYLELCGAAGPVYAPIHAHELQAIGYPAVDAA